MSQSIQDLSHPTFEEDFDPRGLNAESELATLRDFNAKLLERLAEFRRRNSMLALAEEKSREKEREIQRLKESDKNLRSEASEKDSSLQLALQTLEEARRRIVELQKLQADQQKSTQSQKDELSRKLAKLSDEIWSKDLEIEELRKSESAARQELEKIHDNHSRVIREIQESHLLEIESQHETNSALNHQLSRLNSERAGQEAEIERLRTDFDNSEKRSSQALTDLESARKENSLLRIENETSISEFDSLLKEESELRERLEKNLKETQLSLTATKAEQAEQIEQAQNVVASLEEALEQARKEIESERQRAQGISDTLKAREAQLTGEIMSLHAECSGIEKRYQESCEMVGALRAAVEAQKSELKAQARSEVKSLELEYEKRFKELQSALEQDFEMRLRVVETEKARVQHALDTRDGETEAERKNLQKWQVQLNLREQSLRHAADVTIAEKTDFLRLAKQVASELQQARSAHPLRDYLNLTEHELAKLQGQMKAMISPSLDRVRLEERVAQVIERREILRSALAHAQRHLEERSHAIQMVLQSRTKAAQS